jgi:hypothetical protein
MSNGYEKPFADAPPHYGPVRQGRRSASSGVMPEATFSTSAARTDQNTFRAPIHEPNRTADSQPCAMFGTDDDVVIYANRTW